MKHLGSTQISFGQMNHCASACPLNEGIVISCYSGTAECEKDQSVYATYWSESNDPKYSNPIKLGELTGNPVIWSTGSNSAVLLCSIFTKMNVPRIDRWRYCDNWLHKIQLENNRLIIHESRRLDVDIGYLGRCQPIQVGEEWLLPLYREHDCYGMILASKDGWSWEQRGNIGKMNTDSGTRFGSGILIQPTIWHDGYQIHALCRDITNVGKAWYSYSSDVGRTWSKPIHSTIDSRNNSLVVIQDGTKSPWVVWNISVPQHNARKFMVLAKIDHIDALPKIDHVENKYRLNPLKSTSASYPNYCFDNQGILHIVHTDRPNITHHRFSVS